MCVSVAVLPEGRGWDCFTSERRLLASVQLVLFLSKSLVVVGTTVVPSRSIYEKGVLLYKQYFCINLPLLPRHAGCCCGVFFLRFSLCLVWCQDEDELIVPQQVETGDSVKMKQVMDDAAIKAVSRHAAYSPAVFLPLSLVVVTVCFSLSVCVAAVGAGLLTFLPLLFVLLV